MTEDNQEAALSEAPVEEIQEVQEEVQQEVQEEVNTDVEDKARLMGWRPQDEYKGDPNRWTDAETFVKVGEERIPVMKENLNKVVSKNAELEQKIAAMAEYQKEMGQRQYDRAMKDLQEQQRQAVEEADTAKFDQLKEQEKQIQDDYSPKESTQPYRDPAVVAWEAQNTWMQNPTLASKAANVEQRIMEEEAFKSSQDPFYQAMPLPQRLEEVSRRIKTELAPKEPARKLPAVEGTRQTSSSKKPAKTWNDIPAEDRAKGETWIRQGILSQAEYVKDYFGE